MHERARMGEVPVDRRKRRPRSVVLATFISLLVLLLGLSAVPALAAPAAPAAGSRGVARPSPQASVHGDDVAIVARVRNGSAVASVSSTAKLHGGHVRHVLGELGLVTFGAPKSRSLEVRSALARMSSVSYVGTVASRRFSYVPNDTNYINEAGYLSAVGAPAAWDVSKGDASVKIAVLDSGIDTTHPDLAGKIVGAYDAVAGTPNVNDITDTIGHGTFVSGVAAAQTDNSTGIAGAGFDSSLLGVKVSDDPAGAISSDDSAAGLVWAADHGARVINMSYGGPTNDPTEQAAVSYAESKGALLVAAAGNDGTTTVGYPAGFAGVLSVGATDGSNRASFSTHGSWVSVGAPGVGIYSTTPTAGSAFFPGTTGYANGDGTSFSTPLVSGEAALLAAYRPSMTAQQIKAEIQLTADHNAALDLGAGRVNFAAALTHLPPTTAPTITSPTDGSSVSGTIPVVASSDAAAVQFFVDGSAFGARATVAGGAATVDWPTWGYSNGAHSWTASDCNAYACGSPSPAVALTPDNAAPVLTAPTLGRVVGSTVTFTGTAPGGGLAFYVDGVKRGFDGTAPYSFTLSGGLTNGLHNAYVRSCNPSGSLCAGPSSLAVAFTVNALHPAISAATPNPFSPNGDGRRDATSFTVHLPDTESGSWQIRNAAGTTVQGPHSWGTLTAGNRAYTWNGKTNGGTRAPDGIYTIVVLTSAVRNRTTLRGYAQANVRLDATPPVMSGIAGSGATFYPYPDGYADRFSAKVTVNEPGTLWLYVRNSAGTTVRVLPLGHGAVGTFQIAWDGRNSGGALVPAGSYRYFFVAGDNAGNRRTSGLFTVSVSLKRLVNKSATLDLNGNQAYGIFTSNTTCTGYSYAASSFASGVWLDNECVGQDLIDAEYEFSLPSAVRYNSINVDSFGNTISAPEQIAAGIFNYSANEFEVLPALPSLTVDSVNSWSNFGSVSAAYRVAAGKARIAIVVPSLNPPEDYDIGVARIVLSYAVLQ